MSKKPSFQALEVTFKNPETDETFTGFCVCEAMMDPAEFRELFQSNNKLDAVFMPSKVSPPMTFEDLGAYPEFERLMERIAESVGSS